MNIINRTTFSSLLSGARRGLLAAGLLLLGSAAQATPLNLILNDFPDIVSSFITVNYYGATTDVFTASGFAMKLRHDDSSLPGAGDLDGVNITGGTFNLTATIDDSGILAGGALTIRGTVASLGFTSGTLLTGTLTAFGYGAGDPLEFLFDVTGGDAAGLYGSSGAVIMGYTGFAGNFSGDFGSNMAVANTGVVPEPATVWLIGLGLLGLVGHGRLRRRA